MSGRWISWFGLASCATAGLFVAASEAVGRRARALRTVKHVGTLSELTLLRDLLPLVVAVAGRVWSSSPIKCEDESTKAAIVQTLEEKHFLKQLENGDWKFDKALLSKSTREVPWVLDDGSGFCLEIVNGQSASGLNLMTVCDHYMPIGRSLIRSATDHLSGIRILGIRRTERALPVGTYVTAVGELAAVAPRAGTEEPGTGPTGSGLVLRRPAAGEPFYITTSQLPELVESLSSLSRLCKWFAVGFGAVGVYLIASQVAVTAAKEWRARRLRAQMRSARRSPDRAVGDEMDENASTQDRCVVCMERPLDAVFSKCGHMCCCLECATRLQHCPICRRSSSVIRVYLP
uniref:RING-type E3 ubiquitin transferase n=1 Tax=Tetraselmis sp. GSL018 TaxID=582737 RepID=A0A061SG09_9CHLO|mmetsp:Transcript_26819/g.63611  ORF Transcript_26819/g.63611 Transcript_26819/m.63611 type:complete len:347 (+) Transcript_26819:402-1442(+)